jgi:hypothetical protein
LDGSQRRQQPGNGGKEVSDYEYDGGAATAMSAESKVARVQGRHFPKSYNFEYFSIDEALGNGRTFLFTITLHVPLLAALEVSSKIKY